MKRIKGTYLVLIAVLGVAAILTGCSTDGALGPGPDGGPAAVDLGTAGNYVILAKTAISNVPTSAITGDLGLSPAATSFFSGFSQVMAGDHATAAQVTGNLYASDMAVPTPANLTTATTDMGTAFTTAAGVAPDFTELGAGEIGGMTLQPGVYKWGTALDITSDVTLWGSDTATWIFQIAGTLTLASDTQVILAGGALPENIVWQVGSSAFLGTTSHFEGTILAMTAVTLATGATLNGRVLAQSAVALDSNTVVDPLAP